MKMAYDWYPLPCLQQKNCCLRLYRLKGVLGRYPVSNEYLPTYYIVLFIYLRDITTQSIQSYCLSSELIYVFLINEINEKVENGVFKRDKTANLVSYNTRVQKRVETQTETAQKAIFSLWK